MDRRTQCPNCGSSVEELTYCGVCGHELPAARPEQDLSLRGRAEQALKVVRERPQRTVLIAAAVIIFLVLLTGNAAVAAIVGLLVVPFLLVHYLTRQDLFEREPWTLLIGVIGAGAAIGLIGGWVSSLVFDRLWFGDTRLNIGAAGFPGVTATGEGSVPVSVLLINGILLPVLLGAAVLGGPIFLRRWSVFRNEVLDGFTLGGLAAAGFATLSSIVYFWPAVLNNMPDRPVSDWTAIIAGIGVVRPIVLILSGAMLGAAIWQYATNRRLAEVALPAAGGVVGWLGLAIGSLLVIPSGAVSEFIWYLIVLVIVGFVFREALARGLAHDREQLAGDWEDDRVVCPNCRRITPEGLYCSYCGAALETEETSPGGDNRVISSGTGTPRMASEPLNRPDPQSGVPGETIAATSRVAVATPVMAAVDPAGAPEHQPESNGSDDPREDASDLVGEPAPISLGGPTGQPSVPDDDDDEPAWLTEALAREDTDGDGAGNSPAAPIRQGDAPVDFRTDSGQGDDNPGAPVESDARPTGTVPTAFSWRMSREDEDDPRTPFNPSSRDSVPESTSRWQWVDRDAPSSNPDLDDSSIEPVDPDREADDAPWGFDALTEDVQPTQVSSSSGRWFSAQSGTHHGEERNRGGSDAVDGSEYGSSPVEEANRAGYENGPAAGGISPATIGSETTVGADQTVSGSSGPDPTGQDDEAGDTEETVERSRPGH
ncbi:MAG TPA: hypothetical protein VGT61_08915 [Thermomicrobiales bacterium]|jgi:RNA polymerase subunit RPABC4/transcription elongation factor Spt4/type III secretory pathway component EscS|nr:hypothetical protein [Thermomicrobiales bacterium]